MPSPKIIGSSKVEPNQPGPGPAGYMPQSPNSKSTKLGKFGKEERKGMFDKKNNDTYQFKKITKVKLSEI